MLVIEEGVGDDLYKFGLNFFSAPTMTKVRALWRVSLQSGRDGGLAGSAFPPGAQVTAARDPLTCPSDFLASEKEYLAMYCDCLLGPLFACEDDQLIKLFKDGEHMYRLAAGIMEIPWTVAKAYSKSRWANLLPAVKWRSTTPTTLSG